MRCSWLCDCKQPRHRHASLYLGALPSVLGARCFSTPGASEPRHPRRLESYTPRHFDASRPFKPCAAAPLVPRCPRDSVPRCFGILGTSRATCTGASMPRSLSSPALRCPRWPECPDAPQPPRCFGILGSLRATCPGVSTPQGFSRLCSGAFGGTLPQSSVPQCFDTLSASRTSRIVPSVA
ncbi:UNVERIFIED_CONTAM: hypothetical protein FKN15_012753 [Acipenser sinensis]